MAKTAHIGVHGTLKQMDRALDKHLGEVMDKRRRVHHKESMPARTFKQMVDDGTVSNVG